MATTTSIIGALAVGVMLCGCGSDDNNMPPAPATPASDEPEPEEPQVVNGCGATDYEDRSSATADRVIGIAVDGLKFTPPCLKIAVGQTVTFEGSLSAHPLAPGNPNDASAGSPDNPITPTSSGGSVEFSFSNVGTYPYFCELHAFGDGMGMAGAIYVK